MAWTLDRLGSWLAPSRCAACDDVIRIGLVLCVPCAASALRANASSSALIAAFEYGGSIARVLARFKYEPRPEYARPLADLLWRAINAAPRGPGPPVIVPVPLHPRRLAQRGFNQSALLAAHLAARLNSPFEPLALRRTRNTPTQTTLGRAARVTNMRGAFVVRRGAEGRISGRPVLLIDDVRTTGATLDACAAALADAGANRIDVAVVAATEGGSMPDGA